RVVVLYEVKLGESGPVEYLDLPEPVVVGQELDFGAAPLHRLENQQILRHMLVNQVEREQGMAEVVEHAEEEDDVETLAQRCHVVDRHLPELDIGPQDIGRETRLLQIAR